MEEDKKFSLVEIILMLMIVVPVDILEPIVDLISPVPVLGQIALVVMHFADWVILFVIQFWLIMKGVRGLWALAGNLLEFIPYLDALPIRTATLILTIYLANHPKVAQVTAVAGGKVAATKPATPTPPVSK